MKRLIAFVSIVALALIFVGCNAEEGGSLSSTDSQTQTTLFQQQSEKSFAEIEKGLVANRVLHGNDGDIHFSYYLPESYNHKRKYPLMVVMPGYDMMWFGDESAGKNLNWNVFLAWTKLEEEMIVVCAQLTDWHEKSARQAIELTEHFIENYSVDTNRVYAAGYSAGGETMSQAVSMRPDLYAAYLHGASQWDGEYDSVANGDVAVYIYMAQGDEYYGVEKAKDAYDRLYAAFKRKGLSDKEIDSVLQIETPDNAYFNKFGIYNYHAGANMVFENKEILNYIISHSKG